jgi:hypothetical protein
MLTHTGYANTMDNANQDKVMSMISVNFCNDRINIKEHLILIGIHHRG